ncbi:MAG: (Fe-S)-binding protein [Nitrospirae bacterium]|nr:(Fe-S)-binding protein [Nitrospirota bacterium]
MPTHTNGGPGALNSIGVGLKRKVEADLAACIGCHECLQACPVAGPELRIADLNAATVGIIPPSDVIRRFVWECFQCGRCVPACPVGLERDAMVLWQKSNLYPRPKAYADQLRLMGGGGGVARRAEQSLLNLQARPRLKGLAQHVDKRTLRAADTLFFFGCNIFSETGTAAKVLALADYLGCNYEVLGGMRSCCGWPHLLSGDLARSEELMDHLFGRIQAAAPREVVTIGAECYTALKRLVAVKGEAFMPVTTASWIRRNLHRFPIKQVADPLTFHDACHISRKLDEGEEARRILRQFGYLIEMPQSGGNGVCCGYHQFEVNPAQVVHLRKKRLAMARQTGAGTMVVECVRCLEAFAPLADEAGVRVVDLVDLVHDAVKDDSRMKPQPVHFTSPITQGRKGPIPAEGA